MCHRPEKTGNRLPLRHRLRYHPYDEIYVCRLFYDKRTPFGEREERRRGKEIVGTDSFNTVKKRAAPGERERGRRSDKAETTGLRGYGTASRPTGPSERSARLPLPVIPSESPEWARHNYHLRHHGNAYRKRSRRSRYGYVKQHLTDRIFRFRIVVFAIRLPPGLPPPRKRDFCHATPIRRPNDDLSQTYVGELFSGSLPDHR